MSMCKLLWVVSWPARVEILLIRSVYRPFFSPWLGQSCRFEPTCSHYGMDALAKYGFWKGNLLIAWRILRCNPFCKGGYDPA